MKVVVVVSFFAVGSLVTFGIHYATAAQTNIVLSCDKNSLDNQGHCNKCSIDPVDGYNNAIATSGDSVTFICEKMTPDAPVVGCWSGVIGKGGSGPPFIAEENIVFEQYNVGTVKFTGGFEAPFSWESPLPPLSNSQTVPSFGAVSFTIQYAAGSIANPRLEVGGFLSIFQWPPTASTCAPTN